MAESMISRRSLLLGAPGLLIPTQLFGGFDRNKGPFQLLRGRQEFQSLGLPKTLAEILEDKGGGNSDKR